MAFRSNPLAYWFDDYTVLLEDSRIMSDEDEDLPAFSPPRGLPDDSQAAG
jgi:hypothetical protein